MAEDRANTSPLSGVRVLDLTHVWAGPLGTRLLADLGAEVVKIEAPSGRGPREAIAKPLGGWLGGEPGAEPWNRLALFAKLSRNKKSVCLDLKTDAGRRVLLRLAAVADVLVHNFSARAMPRLGLGEAAFRSANPMLIHVAMPGYGTDGPYRDRVAFGPTVEPLTGLTTVLGYDKDRIRNTAMALTDPIQGLSSVSAIVTALRTRDRLGAGIRVELSLHEAGVSYCAPWLADVQLGASPEPLGNAHPSFVPHGVYACAAREGEHPASAYVALACRTEGEWQRLYGLLERAGLAARLPQAAGLEARREASTAIDAAIGAWTSRRDKTQAAAALQAAGVSAGPVNTTPDMVADEQVRARGFFVPLETPPVPMPGNPITADCIDSGSWRNCPKLGADNDGVLRDWLGDDGTLAARLREAGALHDGPPG